MNGNKFTVMEKVCIVIPVHSSDPSDYELVSFKQCFNILSHYPIKVIAPQGLDLSRYRHVADGFDCIYIDPKWQSTLIAYNRLKTSRYFYNLFANYEFIMTYELDAFVFKDELHYWCNQNYDYIGAPWFEGFADVSPNLKLVGVGNSGFSLRKVSTTITLLKEIYYKNPAEYEHGRKKRMQAYLKYPYRWFRNQMGENYTVQALFEENEDIFFGYIARSYFRNFRVAPVAEALKFSFEVRPEVLFKLNDCETPMGCHAWWRYNLEFWRPYIEDFGHKI